MSYTTANFALRTVTDGRVKICHRIYRPVEFYRERDNMLRPDDLAYRGQLDGMRLAFGRYWGHDVYHHFAEDYAHFVSLWGTARRYGAAYGDDVDWPGPNCINGTFQWVWWYTEEEWRVRAERELSWA